MVEENEFKSKAWLLWGLTGNLPGSMSYQKGRLTYRAHGVGTLWNRQLQKLEEQVDQPGIAERLNNAQTTVILNVPVNEMRVWFPWYYFSGGMKVHTGGTTYRFSFARPNDRSATFGGAKISSARQIGKTWQSLLVQTD